MGTQAALAGRADVGIGPYSGIAGRLHLPQALKRAARRAAVARRQHKAKAGGVIPRPLRRTPVFPAFAPFRAYFFSLLATTSVNSAANWS